MTPTPTITNTPIPSPTPSATVGPSPTSTQTPIPSPTSLPPTPTPNPALRGFSFCNQTAGNVASGRFSARLTEVKTEGFPAFERIGLNFELAPESAPLSATASCISERDYTIATGEPIGPGPYVLQLDLPNWLRDQGFNASPITRTLTFTNTRLIRSANFRVEPEADAGATMTIALDQAVPYRLSLSTNPLQIQLEVARSSPLVGTSDQLTVPDGGGIVQVPATVFFLYDGDIWRVNQGTQSRLPTLVPITPAPILPTETATTAPTATVTTTAEPAGETPTGAAPVGGTPTQGSPTAEASPNGTPARGTPERDTLARGTPESGTPVSGTPARGATTPGTATPPPNTATPTAAPPTATPTLAPPTATPTPMTPTPILPTAAPPARPLEGADNLTDSPEDETALAVNADGTVLAFCRALQAGVNVSESAIAVPSALFTMSADGSNARQIAATGINCTDPAFSLDGRTLAFSVDETGASPVQRSIWTVPVTGGQAQRVAGGDEWNRFAPQWLEGGALVYAADAQDGRSTLFLRTTAGEERDIGAPLLVPPEGGARYRSLGRPLASRDGRTIAVEALRDDGSGADMLLLDATGGLQEVIGGGQPERRPYWTRPLAWADNGTLYYLSTACAGAVAQDYALYSYNNTQEQLLAAGQTLGTLGNAATAGNGLVYVVASRAEPGPRGPNNPALRSAATLWFWDVASGARGQLLDADRGIAVVKR